MKTTNRALINYYARLINKGNYKIEDVPEELQPYVKTSLEELKKVNNEET